MSTFYRNFQDYFLIFSNVLLYDVFECYQPHRILAPLGLLICSHHTSAQTTALATHVTKDTLQSCILPPHIR
jgi:hypothetical protein